ncbi:MAG: S9 family peptidase, partial [Verrucomicrobia bacterium]
QARAGFEADKQSLIIYERDRGQMHNATASWDRSVGSLAWASDLKRIFFSAEDHGESPIWEMAPDEKEPHEVVRLHADDLAFSKDGRVLFFTRVSTAAPTEIARLEIADYENATGHGQDQVAAAAVTHINEALLAKIDMQPLESFTFKGSNNDDVQGFIIKPSGFDPNKKYPLKFLIHGGPQGAWGNEWTYRWNAELFAVGNPERFRGQGGYVVVMINFHGSTGYGQKFTDSISGDWGRKPYTDLMKGLDYVEKTFPFIDKNREAALGASYGGYMANWLLFQMHRVARWHV